MSLHCLVERLGATGNALAPTRAAGRNESAHTDLQCNADGHVGLGVKVGKEVANSIRGAILDGKMQVVPVRRGYWGRKIGMLVSEYPVRACRMVNEHACVHTLDILLLAIDLLFVLLRKRRAVSYVCVRANLVVESSRMYL